MESIVVVSPLLMSLFGSVLGTLAEVIVVSGAVVSCTVTVKESSGDSFPLSSVALQVMVVSPSGKVSPESIAPPGSDVVQSTVTGVKKSVALGGVNVTTAPAALVASTVLSAGTVRTGGVVSCTIILNEDRKSVV